VEKEYSIKEVEHENLILASKLIEKYEEDIKRLEAQIEELKLKVYTPPGPIHVPLIKQRLRTTSEIIRALEVKSIIVMEK